MSPRTRSFLLSNLLVAALFAAAVAAFAWWRTDPGRVWRDLSFYEGVEFVPGEAGTPVSAGGVAWTVEGVSRRPSLEQAEGRRTGSRARPGRLIEYVTVRVSAENAGDEPVSLAWHGSARGVELLLATRRPDPRAWLPATPAETVELAGGPALPSGPLEPGERVEGALVFPINRAAREVSVLVAPVRGAGPRAGEATPAPVEVRLPL